MGKYNINDAFIQALQEQEMLEARSHKDANEKAAPRTILNKNGREIETRDMVDVSNPKVGNKSYHNEKGNQYFGTTSAEYASKRNKTGKRNEFGNDVYLADYNTMQTPVKQYQGEKTQAELLNKDVKELRNKEKRARNPFNKDGWKKSADNLESQVNDHNKKASEIVASERERIANKIKTESDTIKLSGEMKDIDVSDGHITATPSIEREINTKNKKSLGQTQLTERKKYWDPVWREYDVDGRTFQFRCQYYEVSGSNQASLWGHEVTLKENYTDLAFAKIPYYNRTWESFEFQSCMLNALSDYMKRVEKSILDQIRHQNGTRNLKADVKADALAKDEEYQTLVKLKEMILNGNSGKKEESTIVEESTSKKCDKSAIIEEIEAALNNALSNVYDKCGVESGDIAPDQALLWDDLVEQFAKLFETLCEQNSTEELDEEKEIIEEANNERLTLDELEEKAHNGEWKTAVIVFKPESFEKEYSEQSRSYEISSDANYFQSGKISSSLFGNCLDGTDQGVRLDLYMKALPEDGLGKRWVVDYCYINDKEEKIEETVNINPTFADFYAKVKADDRFINEINDLYAKLLKNHNFSDDDIEREMDRDLEDKVAEILENGAYLSNEASPELAHELNKLLDESKEIKTESKEDDLAVKYNIKDNLDKLTTDLMKIQNVTKVEYDLDGYLDNINAPITLVHYDIKEKESASEYIDAEKELKEQVLSVMKENGVNVELAEFENNDTYFYIVAYSTNWNADKVDESSEYISKYDELNDLLDTFIFNDEARLEMYNTLSNKNETVLNDEEFSEWIDDMKQNHFDEIKSYLDTMAEELDYHMEKINESEDEIEDTENDEIDGVDYDETISLLDIAINEIPRIGVEEWGKDDEINFCLDTIELLKGLKNCEEEIPKVMYESASYDDWSNGIDEYLMVFKGINYDDGKSDNTYNWGACLTHDLEMTEYETSEGYYLKASAHRAGDVRGNYTTEFLLRFDSRDDFYETIFELSSDLSNEVVVDERVFTIKPSFFSEYVDIYEQDTDNVWEDVYCTCIEELKEIINKPIEESKDIRLGKRETIKRESK